MTAGLKNNNLRGFDDSVNENIWNNTSPDFRVRADVRFVGPIHQSLSALEEDYFSRRLSQQEPQDVDRGALPRDLPK